MIGGNSPKDMARRILRALIIDSVAAEYSWLGQKKKKIFSVLLIKDVIFGMYHRNVLFFYSNSQLILGQSKPSGGILSHLK